MSLFSVSFQQRGFLLEGLSLLAFAKYASKPLGCSKGHILLLSGVYILSCYAQRKSQEKVCKPSEESEESDAIIWQTVAFDAHKTIGNLLPIVETYLIFSYLTKKPFHFETLFKLGLILGGQELAKGVTGMANRFLTHPERNFKEDETSAKEWNRMFSKYFETDE